MPIDINQISFFLDRIRNADSKTFSSSIMHLFFYLDTNCSNNQYYRKYQEERRTKWAKWPVGENPNPLLYMNWDGWTMPASFEDAKSLSWDLYRSAIERQDGGNTISYLLFKNSAAEQNIDAMNNTFLPYLSKALEDIMKS